VISKLQEVPDMGPVFLVNAIEYLQFGALNVDLQRHK